MLENLDRFLANAKQACYKAADVIELDTMARRKVLQVTGGSIAGLVIACSMPNIALAQDMIRRPRPWSGVERNWRPFSSRTATQHPRTSPLHETGGSLHIYDVAHDRFYGRPTQAQAWEIEEENRILRENPGIESYAGYCRELAVIGFLEDEPNDVIVPEIAGLTRNAQELRDLKVGLLLAMNTSTPETRMGSRRGEDISEVNNILTRFPVQSIVINAPENRISGDWFRALYGLDSQNFLATNFGYQDRPMPRSWIKSAQILPRPEDNPNYVYGQAVSGSGPLIAKSKALQINPELNYNFVRYLVYG